MERSRMEHLLQTRNGIGAEVTTPSGEIAYYFYEDFENESGIARAMRTLYPQQDKGKIKSITFIHQFGR